MPTLLKRNAKGAILTRRRLLRATAGFCGMGIGTIAYTRLWEPYWPEIVERPLPIAHLPEGLAGARLVQLSDLHVGDRVDDSYLIRVFRQARAISPDIVVYTGDFTNHDAGGLTQTHRILGLLPKGRRATLATLGNHDYGTGWAQPEMAERVASCLCEAGVTLLRNDIADVSGLQVIGMDDLWANRFEPRRALAAFDPHKAAVALSHNPDTADLPGWDGYAGWILAGHTHGGQCKPPFLPPPLLPVKNRLYTSGEFALPGGRRMYINRGVGHLLPVRFNARPEITVFQLCRA